MKKLYYGLFAAAAIAAAVLAGPVQAQPYGGPGWMMGSGAGPGSGYGPGMMGCGGRDWDGDGRGWGPGMMRGGGYGPGMMYGWGTGYDGDLNLTTDQVKSYLGRMIRNPNLTVGEVKEKGDDIIIAEVVTKQGNALVQRLNFNRHTGFVQPEQ